MNAVMPAVTLGTEVVARGGRLRPAPDISIDQPRRAVMIVSGWSTLSRSARPGSIETTRRHLDPPAQENPDA